LTDECLQSIVHFDMSLQTAILKTLAYSDIFDYPLNLDELHRYLVESATREEVFACVESMSAVGSRDGYYFLAGREEILALRQIREAAARRLYGRAVFYGCVLGLLPFVRMVALTGSLAVMNLSKGADLDYMLVTVPGRLWIARAFSVIFGRLMRPLGYTICINVLISKNALTWPVHDLYSAREMCQMIPVAGLEMYHQLRRANTWTEAILPNSAASWFGQASDRPARTARWFQMLLELALHGKWGDHLEAWAQKLQMQYIIRTYGTGSETQFSADVCQGNFHDHRQRSGESFGRRLMDLGLEASRVDV